MRKSNAVVWLSILIVVLAVVAASAGLFGPEGGSPFTFRTLRGQTAEMYGRGLYRYDSVFTGAGFKGQDAVTLFLAVPLLLLTATLYKRGSLRGGFLLTGILAYFLYVYASMAVSAAYNNLFLVYVALFSASFFAFVVAFTSIDLRALPASGLSRLPHRGPAVLMLAGGLVMWQRKALGYVAGAGLLLLGSMLLVGVIVALAFQAAYSASPADVTAVVFILVMGLICFVPFALFAHGIVKSERSTSPTQHAGSGGDGR